MNYVIEMMVLVAVTWTLIRILYRCIAALRCRHPRRLPRCLPLLPPWGRWQGNRQAGRLARAMVDGRTDPTAHLTAGVILQPDEDPWGLVRAKLSVQASSGAWISHSRLSLLGRRATSTASESVTRSWQSQGRIDWVVTSDRLVGRVPATGEMISIWWSGLAGFQIEPRRGCILLNGSNGWTGALVGPTVAAIAVAAVAVAYGSDAIPVHPGLERVRPPGPPLDREPETVGPGAAIIPIHARRPSA